MRKNLRYLYQIHNRDCSPFSKETVKYIVKNTNKTKKLSGTCVDLYFLRYHVFLTAIYDRVRQLHYILIKNIFWNHKNVEVSKKPQRACADNTHFHRVFRLRERHIQLKLKKIRVTSFMDTRGGGSHIMTTMAKNGIKLMTSQFWSLTEGGEGG